MLRVRVGPAFTAARPAYDAELARWQAQIAVVVDLFLRLSTNRAELAATVHFVYESIGRERGRHPTIGEILTVRARRGRRRPRYLNQARLNHLLASSASSHVANTFGPSTLANSPVSGSNLVAEVENDAPAALVASYQRPLMQVVLPV